ncbi:MAG TPA: hypothetical protein VJL37_11465 [Flavobacterium sp.]|nr:hypothetical protein [Flavobacterium sp.]
MKKLFLLMTGLLIVSCSNDDSASSDANAKTNLYSITVDNPDESYSSEEKKMTFYKGKLLNIKHLYGNRDDYYYSNNLVSEIYGYTFNNKVGTKLAYAYDGKGRIIAITETFFIEDGERANRYFFTYTGNKILIRFGTPESRILSELTVDANNNIISEKSLDENGTISHECTFTYTNGNLTSYTDNSLSDMPITRAYTYTALKNNFNYNQYLFGKEWKMNFSLDNYINGNGLTKPMEAVSENLPSGFIQDNNGIRTIEATIDYSFNDKNQLIKESRLTNTTNSSPIRKELIYDYR